VGFEPTTSACMFYFLDQSVWMKRRCLFKSHPLLFLS
jgi:hypothetical protein